MFGFVSTPADDMSIEFEFQNLNIGGGSTVAVDDKTKEEREKNVEDLANRIFRLSKGGPSQQLRSDVDAVTARSKELGLILFKDKETFFTPLHNAAKRGNHALVKILTESKHDGLYGTVKHETRETKSTPLHLAVLSCDGNDNDAKRETVETLVRAGSDLEAKNADGKTPLDIAKEKKCANDVLTLLRGGDDVEMTRELTPEEVERQKIESAILEGNFIDLTSGVIPRKGR